MSIGVRLGLVPSGKDWAALFDSDGRGGFMTPQVITLHSSLVLRLGKVLAVSRFPVDPSPPCG